MRRQTRRVSIRRARKRRQLLNRAFAFIMLVLVIGAGVFLLTRVLEYEGPAPLPTPTAAPDITAPGSAAPTATLPPAPTSTASLSDSLSIRRSAQSFLDGIGFESRLMINKEETDTFTRAQNIRFEKGSAYTALKGITTFGGNNYRDSFAYGVSKVENQTLARVWGRDMGALATENEGTWTGAGWTGMPIIIQWENDVKNVLGIKDEFKQQEGFTEVIYPAMDGKIYFLDLETGHDTRDPINLGMVMRGTASLDPRGYPLLYIGQGIPGADGAYFKIISLITNQELWKFGGLDPFSHRSRQAYTASALIDAKTDTLIVPGENGILYTVKLNANFNLNAKTVSVNPGEPEKYRYRANGYTDDGTGKQWGMENSVAAWRNYAFFTDNGGYLQCVDLNTLQMMYVVDVLDDSDASIVIEEDYEKDTFYLYTANRVDKQPGITDGYGTNCHRKLNGLTGETIWKKEWKAAGEDASLRGGTLGTPHVGRGNISDIVIFNSTLLPVTVNGETINGALIIAYNKHTSDEVWRYEQAGGYWSSPVVIYDENDRAYLIQCDRSGMMRMHDPADGGKVLFELDMGSRIESTPAVFGNMLVVGTRGQYGSGEGQKIIGVKIG